MDNEQGITVPLVYMSLADISTLSEETRGRLQGWPMTAVQVNVSRGRRNNEVLNIPCTEYRLYGY